MKLELKHLVGYLPYGLRFEGKRKDWVLFDSGIKTLCPIDLDGRWEIIKPILRPLSDLTKEIEVNREKFIPIDVIGEDVEFNLCNNDYVSDWDEKGGNFLNYIDEFIQRVYNNHHLDFMPFGFIQKLQEWHFDIYGLIENDLAISIHDVAQADA